MMKKIIELQYKQIKQADWLKTPIGTIWKSCETLEHNSGYFITPIEDIEEASIMINLDIFEDDDIWMPIKSES